ncbi:helix-turn-helix transcriptional regulator [Robbsia sp. Bb-Pol-6]|uniref:Helix-turn-helix transcriptional regulator n=1 Tax=Robbsia betulipollinis TaxID=2981849 RepID=A0ABT3ZNC3_9BURK|nr:helix-turn-helix transcriptional regulator [Robbsia betulipollinis]
MDRAQKIRENETNVAVGKRLAFARKQKGWSQTELGERLDVSKETVSRIESGFSSTSLQRLSEFCTALDLTFLDLFRGTPIANEHRLDAMQPLVDAMKTLRPDQVSFVLRGAMDLVRLVKTAPPPGDD